MHRREFVAGLVAAGGAATFAVSQIPRAGDLEADPAILAKVISCNPHICDALHFTPGGGPTCPDRSICAGESCPNGFACTGQHLCNPNTCGGGGSERSCASGVFFTSPPGLMDGGDDPLVDADDVTAARRAIASLLDELDNDV